MSELTQEEITEFQKKMQAMERQKMQVCVDQLIALAAQSGYMIVGVPQLAQDGRITATWGIQKQN